jgi:hypothetical protein
MPYFFIVGAEHSSFSACRHDLVIAEGKSAYVANRSHSAPLVFCSMGLRTILNNLDPMLLSQIHDGIHVTRPPRQMDNNDRLGLWRKNGLYAFGSDILAIPIYISENRNGPSSNYTAYRGNKTPWSNNNFISLAHPKGFKGKFQRHGAIRKSHGVFTPNIFRKLSLKKTRLFSRPVVYTARFQYPTNRINLLLFKNRPTRL